MANLIQIKRSLNTASPTSLANGEFAYTANGDVLFIGSNGATVAIGGKRVPGVLTANQALVANATGFMNEVKTANATISSLSANGSYGTAGQVLVSNGTTIYWGTGTSGSDTQVQFNDGGVANGSAGFTFSKTSNTLAVGNTLTVNSVLATGTVNALALSIGSNFVANTTRVVIGTAVGLQANGGIGTAGQQLYSNGTTVYWADPSGDITSVTAGNGLTGGGSSGAVTLDVVGANGITAGADSIYAVGGSTMTVNATGIHVNSTLSIQDLTLSGNLVVSGTLTTLETSNLIVEDPLIALAKDQANSGTYSDAFDIGFFGSYGNTQTKVYTGMFRDQSDSGIYKLFAGQIPDPSTTIDTANVNFALATLQSYLKSSALLSNSTVTNITANSTVSVAIAANTLSLSTALPATSGGTGLNTFTSGDILVANTGNVLNKLSLGTDGHVLQSNGTALVYNTLDGGTF